LEGVAQKPAGPYYSTQHDIRQGNSLLWWGNPQLSFLQPSQDSQHPEQQQVYLQGMKGRGKSSCKVCQGGGKSSYKV